MEGGGGGVRIREKNLNDVAEVSNKESKILLLLGQASSQGQHLECRL